MSALPRHMRADDPAAAEPARRRLVRKSPFPRFPSLPSLRKETTQPVVSPPDNTTDDIHINFSSHSSDDTTLYRWAVLYENQRGITIFSAPFYSPLSLLPSDPPPFTSPDTHASRGHLPNLSLDNYPLPDGTWRWLSTAWMIDMRSDLGEVQHDGFEYNWRFRHKNWHSTIGKLSSGAWVRRRRWVRLMTRPPTRPHSIDPSLSSSPLSSLSLPDVAYVWDGTEQDWHHVHRLLKLLGRDGRKLELWRMWLRPHIHASMPYLPGAPSPFNTLEHHLANVVASANPPLLPHLVTILKNHSEAILRSFVYPDSRAQFVHLVRQAGLMNQLEHSLGRTLSATDVDFWSYTDDPNKVVDKA